MRRNMKKLCCAILCICLLLINTPYSMSYAENMEQNATYTDADTDTATEDVDVPETEESSQAAIGTATAEAEIDAESATTTDALLYAASTDVPEGAYKLEINSQADWDNLFTYTEGDGSGWTNSGGLLIYIEDKNPVAIIINADITLSQDAVLTIPMINSIQKDFLLYGDGQHSINLDGHAFKIQAANTVTIENTHIKNGTVQVYSHTIFSCTDSQFSAASVELYTNAAPETTNITGCKFFDCPGPCINSMGAPCPVSFSDCTMNNSGLLFGSSNPCRVNFSKIKATECTGTVIGIPSMSSYSYIIESVSDCELSTSQSGITAIDHNGGPIGEITGCTITGFDTGIKLYGCNVASDITDTLTISDTKITDCIIGVETTYLSGYKNAMFSGLTLEAREGASDTVGYKGNGRLTNKDFNSSEVNYDFNKIQQIKSCTISGFDTGINLNNCPIVVSDCKITDCNSGVTNTNAAVAIVGTTLTGKASEENSVSVTTKGVTTSDICFLIDSDITDFDIGSDAYDSSRTTIIGCKYENRDTNLICAFETAAYDTSFIGSETSVIIRRGSSYFYDCVVEGDAVATTGFSIETLASGLHIYSMERPYNTPYNGGYYNDVKQNSNGTVKNGKSEIFNCKTGIDAKSYVKIADTHIHDCVTGIKALNSIDSYGNNLIEDCTNGMEVQSLFKYADGSYAAFTDIHVDTIRNCLNDGFTSSYVTSSPVEWKNRLEIYDCDNYGIKTTGSITSATVDVHDCKTGIYIADNGNNPYIILGSESKIYDNREWNIYDDSATSSLIIQGSEGTLIGGAVGNIYSTNPTINNTIITPQDLYSDDSVYYLGTADGMCRFGMDNLYGTVVLDTVDSGYIVGRRVAGLNNPNVASKMFAKKEGFIISTETEETSTGNIVTYAVFAEGYDVTYDVTANGGDTFIDEDNDEEIKDGKPKRISYLKGDMVNLNYKASKPGYTFVGWNTDEDATEGLTTLTAETKDITLYAIYKKTININYHTYNATLDYSIDVTLYNNEDTIELAAYNVSGGKTFAGYVLDEDAAVSSADDLLKAGDKVTVSFDNLMKAGNTVTISSDGLDVYCVYEKQGQLTYLKKDGTTLSTESKTVYEIGTDNKEFVYTVRAGEPISGFTFTGWKDEAGNSFAAGATLSTENNLIVLTPVYVENEEPTPETPTPETPAAGDPVIQPPTTEASTTQAPAGPKTGDSTNPIGVIGLGILSLLGILVLTMKNKRKN